MKMELVIYSTKLGWIYALSWNIGFQWEVKMPRNQVQHWCILADCEPYLLPCTFVLPSSRTFTTRKLKMEPSILHREYMSCALRLQRTLKSFYIYCDTSSRLRFLTSRAVDPFISTVGSPIQFSRSCPPCLRYWQISQVEPIDSYLQTPCFEGSLV